MSLLLKDYSMLVTGGSTVAGRVIFQLLDSDTDVTVREGGEVTTAAGAWTVDDRTTLTRVGFTKAMSWGKALTVCCDEALLHEVTLEGHRRGTPVDDETGSLSPLTPMALTGRHAL